MTDELAPLQFGWDRIVGHSSTVTALRRASAAGRPHPAYLLLGPAGVGKTLVAHTLAASLVCEAAADARPCGVCGPCRKVAARTHTDVWTEVPTGRSKTITVDQVSDVQRRLGFRRLEGRHRVVLFLGAGTMNEHAQNKLLKTLEEPPEGTVIILTALHPGLLLQTVRSRCQKPAFGGVDADVLAQWLMREHGAEEASARVAASASGGLPGRALELLVPEEAEARRARIETIAGALGGREASRDELLKEFDRDREGARAALTLMQELLRDAMASSTGASVSPVHPDQPPPAALTDLGTARLAELVFEVEAVQGRLVRNVHPGGVLREFLRRVGGAR